MNDVLHLTAISAPDWRPMKDAPRDGTPILAICKHDADPYIIGDGRKLTVYGSFCEGVEGHVPDGAHVIVWGGGFDDRTYEEPDAACAPDWWFRHGSDYTEPANPIAWTPIPTWEITHASDNNR